MRKVNLPLTILYFVIWTAQGFAATSTINFFYNPNDLATATGTVQATGLNSIDIFDEDHKRVERFVYLLGDNGQFHQGDYVRIYYHPKTAVVAMIKRMTVLKYKENGQNLGNIFRDNRRN